MAMSRRKQLHPKSLKEGDETIFILPDELKYDEESRDIVARIDLKEGHRFGPFPAHLVSCQSRRLSIDSDSTNTSSMSMQIENETNERRTQTYQVIETKHNWLARCTNSNNSTGNFEIHFQDDQIFLILTVSIPIGTRLYSNLIILPKSTHSEDSQLKQEVKSIMNHNSTDEIKIKEEPIESEEEQQQQNEKMDLSSSNIKSESPTHPSCLSKSKDSKTIHSLFFTCDDCGIRYSNRNTLDAHREHYCTKRDLPKNHSTDSTMPGKMKSIKRKHIDQNDSSPSPPKRLSIPSSDVYCSECDILFSKPDNLLQHKLHYCRTKSSTTTTTTAIRSTVNETNFRPPIPFDRPIQIGQFIYVPVPIVPSQMDNSDRSRSPLDNDNKPLDLSKPKKSTDDGEQRQKSTNLSSSPLDLTMEKSTNLFHILNSTSAKLNNAIQQQIHECEFCSIRFSSLKTLHAHQENYCIEYRKQKKITTNTESNQSLINDNNRCQSPPISSSTISKSLTLSPNDSSTSTSHLPPHRSSPFMCRLCKYRGNTLRGMRMHFKFHISNNEPCTDDDIIITSTMNNLLSTTSSITSSSSSSSSQLLLKCTICSAMFDHEDSLINHIKSVHTKESLLECLECQSRFCSKWNLLRHMKLTHTNIKCDEEEQQPQQDDRQQDESIVSTESQFLIPDQNLDEDRDLSSPSNEKCSEPVNLTRHVLLESMDTNSIKKISDGFLIKKKFACPYCHIKFGSIDTLKQHMTNYCSSRPTTDEQQQLSPNPKKKSNETFCSSCQIPFRHQSSYDAHKMYYCRGSHKAHVKMQA